MLVDESLRDGLQSTSVRNPAIEQKFAMLHAMADIGVDVVSIGLPAAGGRTGEHAVRMAREVVDAKLRFRMTAAARTTESDVEAIARVSQASGAPIEVYAFIGSSPIRHLVESWDLEFLLARVRGAAKTARLAGLPFCLVTEDTTRANPAALTPLFEAAIDEGAARLCLCDTVGHADRHGVEALVTWVKDLLRTLRAESVGLDWHGHNDRGLAVSNALWAARVGVDRVHGTALGIGERVGNPCMEELVFNFGELGLRPRVAPAKIRSYADIASQAIGMPIYEFSAVVGSVSRALDADRAADAEALATRPDGSAPTPHAAHDVSDEPLVSLRTRVNGDVVHVAVPASRTLLEMLRYDLDLVGTKQGCDKGDCGACTVLIDGRPILSCISLAHHVDGREVTTVEALPGAPNLDPLLDAFDRCGAGQCGFCTPGMLMAATALLRRESAPSDALIRQDISGNLCRCTGYTAIVKAIRLAADIRAGRTKGGEDLPGSGPIAAPLRQHKDREKSS